MTDSKSKPSYWTEEHEELLERANRLEEARIRNRAAADARVVLHDGPLGIAQTREDFHAEKRRAAAAGTPIDPQFRSWAEWEGTARAFREALAAMYPAETEHRVRALGDGETDQVEWALLFLETDPRCFRAGYLRERILRYLARMIERLSTEQMHRLRWVALAAVDDPWRPATYDPVEAARRMGAFGQNFAAKMGPQLASFKQRQLPFGERREYKWFCRLARNLNDPDLARDLEARARTGDPVVARRATLMLGAIAHRQEPTLQA